MASKKRFKRRERNGVRKFWYIFIMALLSVIYLCGQQFCEWERLTETFATVIAIVTIAFVALKRTESVDDEIANIKEAIKKELPEHMQTETIIAIQEIPLTTSGKVDYRELEKEVEKL